MESLSVNVDRTFLRDEVYYVGSDRTSRSAAGNQVPRTNRIVSLMGFKLSIAFPKTDLKPLNNNIQYIKQQFWIGRYTGFWKNWFEWIKNIFSWKSTGEVIHKAPILFAAMRNLEGPNIITIRKIFDEERRELTA